MKSYGASLPCPAASKFAALGLAFLFVLAACSTEDLPECDDGQRLEGSVCICEDTLQPPIAGMCGKPMSLPPLNANVVDSGGDTGRGLSMVLDNRDYPHLAYYEANSGDLRYATLIRETGSWRIETVDSIGDVGKYPSIALYNPEATVRPVIVYYDETQRSLKGAFRSADGWQVRYLDPEQGGSTLRDLGTYTSMVIEQGESQIAHIAYIDVQGRNLMYLRWNLDRGEVSTPRLVDAGFTNIGGREYGSGVIGEYTSIALNPQGEPVIAYRDVKLGDLKIAVYNENDDRWTTQFVDNNPLVEINYADTGMHSSLAIDDLGNYHVSYHNRSDLSLRYGHFDGSQWSLETVERGSVGRFTSIALRDDRTPIIAYHDFSRGAAKLAHKRRDGRWQIEFAATQGNPGFYMRLALTSEGWPAIAYQEFFARRVLFDFVTWTVFQ